MPTEQIVSLLIAERDRLTRAIEALQGPTKRRGRPPKNPFAFVAGTAPAASAPAAREGRRRPRTAAQKKAQSERMRKYWAERRKQSK
jgi:hypothetical protein